MESARTFALIAAICCALLPFFAAASASRAPSCCFCFMEAVTRSSSLASQSSSPKSSSWLVCSETSRTSIARPISSRPFIFSFAARGTAAAGQRRRRGREGAG